MHVLNSDSPFGEHPLIYQLHSCTQSPLMLYSSALRAPSPSRKQPGRVNAIEYLLRGDPQSSRESSGWCVEERITTMIVRSGSCAGQRRMPHQTMSEGRSQTCSQQKGVCPDRTQGLYLMVAGTGFEPATAGLWARQIDCVPESSRFSASLEKTVSAGNSSCVRVARGGLRVAPGPSHSLVASRYAKHSRTAAR
jgi:hypothetical protein